MLIHPHLFVSALHDAQWIVTKEGARPLYSRTDEGTAWTSATRLGFEIDARSGMRDAPRDLADEIRDAAHLDAPDEILNAVTDVLRRAAVDSALVRILGSAAAVVTDDARHVRSGEVIAVNAASPNPLLLVTTRQHLNEDLRHLTTPAANPIEADYRRLPIVWRGGSGGVLLHELAGHPSEHAIATESGNIQVFDDPALQIFETMQRDDCGNTMARVALSDGVPPPALRRPGYREAPSRRMTAVAVTASETFEPPRDRHLEVVLTAGGAFDPLTDSIRVAVVSAFLVDGDSRQAVGPFTFAGSRNDIAARLRPVARDLVRYPGVICSDEGIQLPVSTWSVDLTTRALDD